MQDAFQQAEQEFFRLRGQFSVGHITAEEYDEALRHLQVRDAEGRVWMLGANSGRWYYTDSPQWVKSEPIHDPAAGAEQVVFSNHPSIFAADEDTTLPNVEPFAQSNELPQEQESFGATRRLALVFFGIGLTFLLVAFAFFILFAPDNKLFARAATEPTPTRITPRIAAGGSQIDGAVHPTVTAPQTRTRVSATFGAPIPVTVTPGLVIEPTSTEPALTVIPTITPNANPDTPSEPRFDSLPPAVYITNIRVSPNPPRQNSAVTFTASFYNTNRESVGMYWRIVLLDPNRQGRNKDYGESPAAGITVPPGRSDFSITYVPVTTTGACFTLQALAARRRDDNSRDYLVSTGGGPYATNFTFC